MKIIGHAAALNTKTEWAADVSGCRGLQVTAGTGLLSPSHYLSSTNRGSKLLREKTCLQLLSSPQAEGGTSPTSVFGVTSQAQPSSCGSHDSIRTGSLPGQVPRTATACALSTPQRQAGAARKKQFIRLRARAALLTQRLKKEATKKIWSSKGAVATCDLRLNFSPTTVSPDSAPSTTADATGGNKSCG